VSKASAERGDPSDPLAFNSCTDRAEVMLLLKMSFYPSPPETSLPAKATKSRSHQRPWHFAITEQAAPAVKQSNKQ
jgi:hypothetical protein